MSGKSAKFTRLKFGHGLLWLMAGLMLISGPAPTRAQAPAATPIPIEQDPNDPMSSKQERIRRLEVLIKNRRAESRRMKAEEEARVKAEKAGKKKAAPPKPGTAAPTPKKEQPKGSQPSRPKAPAAEESGLAINKKARVPHATFYMLPASINVLTGETFAIDTRLLNPDQLPIDRVQVLLNYPTDIIQPMSIHQDAISTLLADEPQFLVDPENGVIIYRAVLNRPMDAAEIALIKIVWKALTPTDGVEIRPSVNGEISAAFQGDKVVTEGMLGAEESLGGAIVRIQGAAPAIPQGRRIIFDPLRDISLVKSGFPEQASLQVPGLWIDQPTEGLLEAGQWLTIDLGIDNPDRTIFDEIRLAARFDPEVVEIVDADRGNWISSGVNLLDGPFREMWPWDIHYVNRVDNERGYFQYRMAMKALREQPSGAVVRVFARIRKPVQAPVFEWIRDNETLSEHPTTGVYLFGENLERREQVNAGELAFPGQSATTGPIHEKANPAIYRF